MKKWLAGMMAGLLVIAMAMPVAAEKARSITLGTGRAVMTEGATRQFTVRYSPRTADQENETWRSSDDEVATVDSSGLVTAHKRGDAVISVKLDSGLRTSVQITVREEGQYIKSREMEMSVPTMLMRVDQVRSLAVYFTPSDVSDKDVIWSSADTNIATVDPYGDVTAVAPGRTTITATSADGITATCVVTVSGTVLDGIETDVTVNQSQNSSEILTSAAARTAVETAAKKTKRGETGYAVFVNKTKIPTTVIGAAGYSAKEADRDIRMRMRTESEGGKLQGYITIDPAQLGGAKGEIGTAVYNRSKAAVAAQEALSEEYSNKLAAIELNHTGIYGFPVTVAVKPSVSGLKTADLHLYTYNSRSGRLTPLETSARVDKNGFVHFTTETGGIIVFANGELK